MKKFQIVGEDLSDGYHTFDELYDHRCLLFINLCLKSPGDSLWKPGYDGWPLLVLVTLNGQISYHVPEKYLSLFKDTIPRKDDYVWDGHTSDDVLDRLKRMSNRSSDDNLTR